MSSRYLLFFRTILAGTLLLEAMYAPEAKRVLEWVWVSFPLYGICAFTLWALERFGRLSPLSVQGSFLLDLALAGSAAHALPGRSMGVFVAFFLIVLSSTLLRKPAFSFLVAAAACLVYGALTWGGDGADPGRSMKFALLAAIASFSAFMTTYARAIESDTAGPYERRIAWMERLSMAGKALAGILHEVKTPLGTIVLGVENIRAKLRRGEKVDEELDVIRREAERASEILVNFLEFTRPAELALTPLRLAEPLDKAAAAMRLRLEERGVALDCAPATEALVLGSQRHLVQAFTNLFMNAVDAMPGGGRLTVRQEERAGRAWVRISDTGAGISAEDLVDIFEPASPERPGSRGFGLGLGIARWIVSRHHGELLIESPGPGLGACATVSLPLSRES